MSSQSNFKVGSSSPNGPEIREEQVRQAITFLNDPRTQSASKMDKESFLRNKGLTELEIAAAFSRQQTTLLGSHGFDQTGTVCVRPAFMDEPILWSAIKSIFSAVGAIAIGVVGYHVYSNETQKSLSGSTQFPETAVSSGGILQGEERKLVTEEAFLDAIQELTVKQELRHKELMLQLRDVSALLSSSKIGRKPGGSIVIPNTLTADLVGNLTASSASETVESSEPSASLSEADIEREVKNAIENGIDTTLLLVLSSLDNNRKLNKSNPRFKKLERNALMQFVGYTDGDDFLQLMQDEMETSRVNAQRIVADLKRMKAAAPHPPLVPIENLQTDANISSVAPWLPAVTIPADDEPRGDHLASQT